MTSLRLHPLTIILAALWPVMAEKPPTSPSAWIPLKTKLPKAVFEVRPLLPKIANFESVHKRQAPVLLPRGLTNQALGKSVSSSDTDPKRGRLADITDGNKESTDDSHVELGFGRQWVQIDLEQETKIFAIWLWHFHSTPRAYIDVQRCRKLFSCLGVGFAQSRGGLAPGSLAVDKVA
jgi:hypothetical protein